MESQQQETGTHNTRLRLQQLIDGLVGNSLPIAKSNGTVVVNEVGRGVVLRKVNAQFTSLLEDVLTAVIRNSKKGNIHISLRKEKQQLVLCITDKNNYNGYALSFSIGALAQDAVMMGGSLDIRNPQQLEATVCLYIPDKIAA